MDYPPEQCICSHYPNGMIKHEVDCLIHGSEPLSMSCNRDHCAPEERVTLDIVSRFYETPKLPKPRFISRDCDTGHCTDRERDLLDALLAAQAGKETSG